jgi:hypothetical protein
MPPNQKVRRRYCGYCGQVFEMDFVEWIAHTNYCEREMGKWYRKTRGKGDPYNDSDLPPENMEGNCK